MSSTTPSVKYSCSISPLRFRNGSVADGLARRVDVTGQGRFRDDPPGPHGIQELVLADDVLAVSHQMEQQVEDLRPDGDQLGAVRELPPVRVDHVVLERVLHVALSSRLIAMAGKPLIAR